MERHWIGTDHMKNVEPFKDWVDMKQRLIGFRSMREGSICGLLLAFKQEMTVEEYRKLFD